MSIFKFFLCCATFTLALLQPAAYGIVINDASYSVSDARQLASGFDAVVAVIAGSSLGTGVLIDANTVLTAKHVTDGEAAGNVSVRFGDRWNAPDFTRGVSSVYEAPDGAGYLTDGTDVSILTLTSPVSNITPMRLLDDPQLAVGQTGLIIGYGRNGIGDVGHQNTLDGYAWAGENVIDHYGQETRSFGFLPGATTLFSTDFDDGTSNNNNLDYLGSSATPLTREATTAGGDSGGPLLVENNGEYLVAGLLSGGTTSTSVYGDISWWTGLEPYQSLIESHGGEFVIPEPSVAIMLAMGACFVISRRRVRV